MGRVSLAGTHAARYLALDEVAHEEGPRFGACMPFKKENGRSPRLLPENRNLELQ